MLGAVLYAPVPAGSGFVLMAESDRTVVCTEVCMHYKGKGCRGGGCLGKRRWGVGTRPGAGSSSWNAMEKWDRGMQTPLSSVNRPGGQNAAMLLWSHLPITHSHTYTLSELDQQVPLCLGADMNATLKHSMYSMCAFSAQLNVRNTHTIYYSNTDALTSTHEHTHAPTHMPA